MTWGKSLEWESAVWQRLQSRNCNVAPVLIQKAISLGTFAEFFLNILPGGGAELVSHPGCRDTDWKRCLLNSTHNP